jgi:hypothetical protein
MTGPKAGARIVVNAHTASAASAWRFGTSVKSRVCDKGISGPPQTPSATRQSINMFSVGARPQSKEKTPNPAKPSTNILTGPNRAASQPVSGTVMASATP